MIYPFSAIAIPTQHLEPRRKFVSNKPEIQLIPTFTDLAPMIRTVFMNMVNGQKLWLCNTATRTNESAVSGIHTTFQFYFVSLLSQTIKQTPMSIFFNRLSIFSLIASMFSRQTILAVMFSTSSEFFVVVFVGHNSNIAVRS